MLDIKVIKTTAPKPKPSEENLGFGQIFSDHMFIMNYDQGQGWHDARIIPYGPLELPPASALFHYGQECFEGLKAYRTAENRIQLFRPDCNARRLINTQRRMCIPEIPQEDFIQAVKELVALDRSWTPHSEGASLYIRPFVIATMEDLSVHASTAYQFVIICAPSGAYYKEGLAPIQIHVEDEFIRSVPGMPGYAKCGGNYAGTMLAGERAAQRGFSAVLWLDGRERKYVEEVGAMNIFFKIDGKVYTARAEDEDGTILPGVTRRSIIELLHDWNYEVIEGRLAIDDIMQAGREGRLEEVFGSGTAAVVSPVKLLEYRGESVSVGNGGIGLLTQKLYDTVTGIQWGKLPDTKGWIVPVCQD